jgi:acyl carrier protein
MTEESDRSLESKVCALIAAAVGCDPARVTPTAGLMDEVGLDSLDFLDLVFQLERTFGIQITRGEMEAAARGDMTEEDFAPSGVISERGLQRLRTLMPEAAARIAPGLRAREILGLFTARTFAKVVKRAEEKRDQKARGTAPGASQ